MSTERHSIGNSALKIKLQVQGDNRSVTIVNPLCGGSAVAVDQRGKTLKASVFLEGPALPMVNGAHMLSLQVYAPRGSYVASIKTQPVAANTWIRLSAVLDDRADLLNMIGVGVYLNGSPDDDAWTGNLYVDDVRIE